MPLAYWRDEYRTGNSLVDDQHQQLFKIVNLLHDAMLQGHGRDVVKKTLNNLTHYTLEHFKTEEQLMLTHAYPHYEEHKGRHEELKAKVLTLIANFEESSSVAIEVSHFLTDWLIHHIKGEDQKMIRYMREKVGVHLAEYLACEPISPETRDLIGKLQKEHLAIDAIARITGVSEFCLQLYLNHEVSLRSTASDSVPSSLE